MIVSKWNFSFKCNVIQQTVLLPRDDLYKKKYRIHNTARSKDISQLLHKGIVFSKYFKLELKELIAMWEWNKATV